MESQSLPLKPERLADLQKYAQLHGQTPADALDELLAMQLDAQKREHEETVKAVLEADEQIEAGLGRPAEEFLEEVRVRYGFPR